MNEQQRVILAIFLSMGIFVGYQFLVGPPVAPSAQGQAGGPASAAPSAPSVKPAGVAMAPTPSSEGVSPLPVRPSQSRTFATSTLGGQLSDQQAGLTELHLADFFASPPGAATQASGTTRPPLSLAAPGAELQARIDWQMPSPMPIDLHFVERADASPGYLLRGRSGQGIEVEVDVEPQPGTYALRYILRAHNTTAATLPVGVSMTLSLQDKAGSGGSMFSPKEAEASLRALCRTDGKQLSKEGSSLRDGAVSRRGGVEYAALDRQYFLLAAIPEGPSPGECTLQRRADRVESVLQLQVESLAPGKSLEHRVLLFAGPKRDAELNGVAPVLEDTIDYTIWRIPLGFLARPMVWFMGIFHQWTHSWGVAIMLLTLLVKSVLFPVTYKSVVAMRKMQDLKPELDRIKARYPDDRERQSMEQMKLYRDRGVNPFGGCLPTLLQMPVWLALYRTLWSAVDLYHQPFLWLPDLTSKEPFPFLALALGGLTIFQQRLTPMATDNQQAKIMMWVMPVMLSFLMISLPSGLVLYILVNTILTILQHLAINRRTAPTPTHPRRFL
jgi:YidC/Oxa1 family membrane protein insertase